MYRTQFSSIKKTFALSIFLFCPSLFAYFQIIGENSFNIWEMTKMIHTECPVCLICHCLLQWLKVGASSRGPGCESQLHKCPLRWPLGLSFLILKMGIVTLIKSSLVNPETIHILYASNSWQHKQGQQS